MDKVISIHSCVSKNVQIDYSVLMKGHASDVTQD